MGEEPSPTPAWILLEPRLLAPSGFLCSYFDWHLNQTADYEISHKILLGCTSVCNDSLLLM